MILEYYIFDPTGNITALVTSQTPVADYRKISSFIMEKHPDVEQVGFVDLSGEYPKLHMAGGELCGNATLSSAALYCQLNNIKKTGIKVSVFGAFEDIDVNIEGENGQYTGEVFLPKSLKITENDFYADGKTYRLPLVEMPGISHIIADESIDAETAEKLLIDYAGKSQAEAVGIMLYNSKTDDLLPIVFVKSCGTLVRENSCVSGSFAVASYLSLKRGDIACRLIQPGGVLEVCYSNDAPLIKITGKTILREHIKEVMIK